MTLSRPGADRAQEITVAASAVQNRPSFVDAHELCRAPKPPQNGRVPAQAAVEAGDIIQVGLKFLGRQAGIVEPFGFKTARGEVGPAHTLSRRSGMSSFPRRDPDRRTLHSLSDPWLRSAASFAVQT